MKNRSKIVPQLCGALFMIVSLVPMVACWGQGLIPVLSCLPFFLVGLGLLITPIIRKRKNEALKADAILIHASYVRTQLNLNYSVNDRHPYNIVCSWENPETGEVREFISQNYWGDPSRTIAEKRIRHFPVYVSRTKSSKYLVDLSVLDSDVD